MPPFLLLWNNRYVGYSLYIRIRKLDGVRKFLRFVHNYSQAIEYLCINNLYLWIINRRIDDICDEDIAVKASEGKPLV